jgi:hypothetical protein
MRETVPALRKAAIVVVAVCSVVGAVFLVWMVGSRDQIGSLSNGHLLGVLALFLLPGATAAAWELDRRATARAVAKETIEAAHADLHEFAERKAGSHAPPVREPQPMPGQRAHAATTHAPSRRHRPAPQGHTTARR